MAKVKQLGVHLSLTQIAAEFGCARETAKGRLDAAGVGPTETRGGYPVYRLRGVVAALTTGEEGFDPDKLKPWERKAHYQAEHEKLRLQVERGELVPAIEVEREFARSYAIVSELFDTLPDVLERDVGLGTTQLTRAERCLDEKREALYQTMIERGAQDADSAVSDRA